MVALKLGRETKAVDPRTIRYSAVRTAGSWTPPASYSWDAEHPDAVPVPMFGNDAHGDCVEAGKAHQVLRFEFQETGTTPPITTTEVLAEYFRQSGGADHGLVVLHSLRDWRNLGRLFGGKRYRIHSFMEVMPQNHDEVKEAMVVLLGLEFGVNLPISASDQLNAGAPWDLVAGDRGRAGSWGGHLVHGCEYSIDGVTVETWGRKQLMTWRWLDAYCDECYGVVDAIDNIATTDIDHGALTAALANVV